MTILGYEIRLRPPVLIQRVTGWHCVRCDEWRPVGRHGRCDVCLTPLRRARP